MRSTFLIVALAATALAAPSLAAESLGYNYRSAAGPMVAWIPSFALDYPQPAAEAVEISPDQLAITEDVVGRTYVPEKLRAGWEFESPTGPQIAFVPADNIAPQPMWLSNAAEHNAEQLGFVPDEAEDQPPAR